MLRFNYVIIAHLLFLIYAVSAFAGFTVDSLSLRNTIRDSSGPSSIQETDRITDIVNPLQRSSAAQLGNNIASSSYDFSWIEDIGIGDFNTTFSHAMRNSLGIRTVTNVRFFIETDIDLMVSLAGSLDYSHTPGDETQFLFGASVRDIDSSNLLYSVGIEGGNADFLPASGILSFADTVFIPAGRTYQLLAVLDADDLAETNPGIYDANGFVNISIRPVPEPHTALLLLFGTAAAVYRRPRRALACDQRAPSLPTP